MIWLKRKCEKADILTTTRRPAGYVWLFNHSREQTLTSKEDSLLGEFEWGLYPGHQTRAANTVVGSVVYGTPADMYNRKHIWLLTSSVAPLQIVSSFSFIACWQKAHIWQMGYIVQNFVADKIISFLPISAWLKISYLGHCFQYFC